MSDERLKMGSKIIPIFSDDSPQARKIRSREISQKISECSSKCLKDIVTASFEEVTMRAERYYKLEESGEITSAEDNLVEDINKITKGMLTAPNLVMLGNRNEIAIGHALEIFSELAKLNMTGVFFSLQERAAYLGQLMLGIAADISHFRVEKGAIADTMWPLLTRSSGDLSDSKLFLNDRKDVTFEEIKDEVSKLKKVYGHLDLVIIDNIEDLKSNSKDTNFIDLLKKLHNLANEQDSIILVLARQDLKENICKNREEKPIEQQSELEKGIRLHADFAYNLSDVNPHQGTVDFSYCNLKDGIQDSFEYFSKDIVNYASFNGLIGREM
jgi:replicative DNA helicase